jgi:O-antigen ligase
VIDGALVAATTALLLIAPFAGSAGSRGALLLLAGLVLLPRWRAAFHTFFSRAPRGVLTAWAAWAAWSIASLAWSADAHYSLGELKAELLYGFAAFALYLVAVTPARVPLWLGALAAGTVLASVGAAIQPWLPAWWSRHPIDGGPGYLSTHVVLAAPALVAWALLAPNARARVGWSLAILCALLLAAWHSANRIVWVALAAEIAVAFVAWRHAQRLHAVGARRGTVAVVVAIVVVGAAFAAAVVAREDRVAHYAVREGSIEADLRPQIWERAAERVRASPWLGYGFGREILAADFIPLTPHEIAHPELRHAHNAFIDVALQLGLVGLALLLALLLALAREYARMLKDADAFVPGIVGLATLAGFVAKNMTDDFFHRHNALVFWMLQGALLGLAHARRRR